MILNCHGNITPSYGLQMDYSTSPRLQVYRFLLILGHWAQIWREGEIDREILRTIVYSGISGWYSEKIKGTGL